MHTSAIICSLPVLVLGARDADMSENGLGPQGVPAARDSTTYVNDRDTRPPT